MVKLLNEIKDEYGDLDCWYSKDDEGNGYYPVGFDPSVMFKPFSDQYELCSKDEITEYFDVDEEYELLKDSAVVCVN